MSHRKTILLVEDNGDDVFFMKRAMKSAEIQNPIQVVTDGQEAIDYLEGNGKFSDRLEFPVPHVVLLDLKLPHREGHEVLQWARQQPSLKTLVIIILTTSRERSDIELAYQFGANAYLVKPPGAPQLVEMVKALKEFWLVQNEFAPVASVAKS
ncbi:MAG: response regulator [Verrucomicrobiota bacterium]